MADNVFEDPRLASIYDALDSDRSDLSVYLAIVREFGVRSVVDVGCGTGVFACLLADEGLDVTGIDPAAAMLEVAGARPGAERVRWINGAATDLSPMQVDLATMTGNVAQVFLDDDEWIATLAAVRTALAPDGVLVFETRRPERRAWEEWNPEQSFQRVEIPDVGVVETWNEVIDVALPFVTFQATIVFLADNTVRTSTSTLRFRTEAELHESLGRVGCNVREVREAPDRPGKEYVFICEPNRG